MILNFGLYKACYGITCINGGVLEEATCTCTCPADFSGYECEKGKRH